MRLRSVAETNLWEDLYEVIEGLPSILFDLPMYYHSCEFSVP